MTDKTEHVYFIETEFGLVKIGRTRAGSARKRPMEIISGLPIKSTLIHIIRTNNCAQLERSLHAKYAPYRVRGEWFALPHDEIQRIRNQDEVQYADVDLEFVNLNARISEEDSEALEVLAPKFGGNKSKAVRASIHFLRENFNTFEWQHPEIFGPLKSDGRKG
jgi:Meiotically up-regulated gene 113